jgi:hypothetical protein
MIHMYAAHHPQGVKKDRFLHCGVHPAADAEGRRVVDLQQPRLAALVQQHIVPCHRYCQSVLPMSMFDYPDTQDDTSRSIAVRTVPQL